MLDYNDLSFPKLCYIISNQRSGYLVIKLRYNPTLHCDCPVKYYAKILLCSLVNMVNGRHDTKYDINKDSPA